MENDSGLCRDEEQMELPPGFRFHPTDEELITHYLSEKVLDSCFYARAIGDVDLNKVEPWDLPWKAKMGEREWYFFCVRDRKYPTGLRTNRATVAGYWKATGKDKEIWKGKSLVGMKKTLVFYKGRAPKGTKTNWVMHEYRLEGKYSLYNLPQTAKNEWVISRIFQKNASGKRTHISGLVKIRSSEDELQTSNLPPLMDCSAAFEGQTRSTAGGASHVTCFSDAPEEKNPHDQMADSFVNPLLASSSASKPPFPKDSSAPDSLFSAQFLPNMESFNYLESTLMQDQSMMRFLFNNMKRESREFSTDTGMSTDMSSALSSHEMDPILSAGPVDLDCLWNYY
ncbi:hypothetical protein RHGRI_023027 [Rhododendron griersonianum]|uniref:NAC domain-containing protein n=1 Tax=Rhododendron griersonianum TaxID=479676 RepID=A0AAV6J285_9ERIC|nr:hypothetical protein RHGRI_023027 [Rhododendron griersonianum]